jgi:hypothetical protein
MPCAVNATSVVTATTSIGRHAPDAILGQLSVSVAQINQTISAVVMNAEAALRMLGAQPADTEAVRRLLACIIKDGMRTGDIVSRTRALIENEPPRRDASPTDAD